MKEKQFDVYCLWAYTGKERLRVLRRKIVGDPNFCQGESERVYILREKIVRANNAAHWEIRKRLDELHLINTGKTYDEDAD